MRLHPLFSEEKNYYFSHCPCGDDCAVAAGAGRVCGGVWSVIFLRIWPFQGSSQNGLRKEGVHPLALLFVQIEQCYEKKIGQWRDFGDAKRAH